jgi:cysteine desulfurase
MLGAQRRQFAPEAWRRSRSPTRLWSIREVLARRLAALAAQRQRALVSVMLANNETGIVQPIPEVAAMAHEAGALAARRRGAGRWPYSIDINDWAPIFSRFLRINWAGPRGPAPGAPERGAASAASADARRRPGARLARAAPRMWRPSPALAPPPKRRGGTCGRCAAHGRLAQRLEAGLQAATPQAIISGAETPRLPNTVLVAVPGMKAETAVIALDLAGFAVSSGAACSSGKVQASHVLAAMGASDGLARGGVRISLGWTTTEAEIDCFIAAWIKVAGALLKETRGLAA